MKFVSPVRQKVSGKKRDTPSYPSNFSVSDYFLKAERFPYQFSRCYETQKIFERTVMSPPPARALLCMTIFDTRSFLKYRCVPLRDLSLVWNKSSTVNGEILFWCIKISIPEVFRNTERLNGYTTKFIGTMRHKKKSEKPVMLPRPSVRENFRYKIFLESEKSSNTIFYGTMRRKTFDRKSWYPILCMNFFRYPKNFCNTEVFSNVYFYYCETKIFDKPVMPSPSYPW